MKWSQLKQGWLMNTWEWEEPPGQSQDMLERMSPGWLWNSSVCSQRRLKRWSVRFCSDCCPHGPHEYGPGWTANNTWMNERSFSHKCEKIIFFQEKNCKALVKNRSNFHWYSWFNLTKIHKKKPAKIWDISQVDVWIPHSTLHLWTCESTSKMK